VVAPLVLVAMQEVVAALLVVLAAQVAATLCRANFTQTATTQRRNAGV
jgi:hypothetical protein